MSAPIIDLHPFMVHDIDCIREDLKDIAEDIGQTAKDLRYSNRRGSVAILRANYEALGQAIEQLTQRGER